MLRGFDTRWRGGLLAVALLALGCSTVAGLGDYKEASPAGGTGGDVSAGAGGGVGGDALGGGGSGAGSDCDLDGDGTAWDPALIRTVAGTEDARGTAVISDSQRRLVIAGWYQGALLDPDGSDPLCPDSGGTRSAFVVRWSKDGTGRDIFCFGDDTGDQEILALAVGEDDAIFAGGRFVGTFAVTYPVAIGATEMSGVVFALDARDLGVNANLQIGTSGEQRVSELMVASSQLWVGGWFEQELFIHGNSHAAGGAVADAFVVPMTLDLTRVLDVHVMGNDVEETSVTGLGIDPQSGRVVVTGWFGGTVGFPTSPLTSAGGRDGYVAALDATSGWVVHLAGATAERLSDVAVGPNGDVYVVGDYESNGALLQGDGTMVTLTSAGPITSGLVAALTPEGEHGWHHWVTNNNGAFNFYAVETDGTHVLYGGSYVSLGLTEGGSECVDRTICGDLMLPNTTTRSAMLAVYDAQEGATVAVRLGQGSQDAYLRDIAFDACGSALVLMEYSADLSFGATWPEHERGVGVARLYRP